MSACHSGRSHQGARNAHAGYGATGTVTGPLIRFTKRRAAFHLKASRPPSYLKDALPPVTPSIPQSGLGIGCNK